MKQPHEMAPARRLLAWAMAVLLFAGVLVQSIALAALDDEAYVDADLIRVGISDDAMTALEYPLAQISATGPFTLKDKVSGLVLLQAQGNETVSVRVDSLGFSFRSLRQAPPTPAQVAPVFNALNRVPGPLLIEPVHPAHRLKIMNITRRKEIPEFRGVFEIVRASSSPNKLTVVNVVSLEDYLKAVVPNELPMRYGLEAVRAQAVAARNYAIRPREKPWKTFDICDSQLCQVYLGSQTETEASNKAIADTEGLVGLYEGEPILALFSSSHGGYAENYSYAFSDPVTRQYPAPPIPYLQGGPDVPQPNHPDLRSESGARKFWTDPKAKSFDVESPHYRWRKDWTRAELEAAINKGLLEVSQDRSTRDFVSPLLKPGNTIGTLKNIKVLERGVSGKAMVMAIEGSKGTWTVKKEFLIRKVLNHKGRMLPSGNIVLSPIRDAKGALLAMSANGGGFGHGVGLSQLGASWMHKHGYRFPQIVQHYYKGVSLGSLPVSVGPGKPSKPVLTRFDGQHGKGNLWLQAERRDPVRLKINGKALTLEPEADRASMNVSEYLRPGEQNTLLLYPDSRRPDRKLKAWVELYPPN